MECTLDKTLPCWQGFKGGAWTDTIDVVDFIQNNYTPYLGDDSFLAEPTQRTLNIWSQVKELMKKEHENNGLLDADVSTPSQIDAYAAGYIDKENELIVGLQTDAPLKRAIMPWGGHRMVEASCQAYGIKEDEKVKEICKK